MIIWKDEVAHRSSKKGSNPSKLGRWTWTVLEGKGGTKTRVVCVYRPVWNTLTGSAYQQQRRFFLARNKESEPREALFEDLDKEVKMRNRANKNIIIAGDFNADVRSKEVQDWMGKWKLREGILEMHGANAPPTFNNGSKPICLLYTSPSPRDLSTSRMPSSA